MKILILRGDPAPGAAPLRPRRSPTGRSQPTSTRERGVVAVGTGEHWVLVNVSPSVAHQLDSDLRLDLHPGLPQPSARAVVLTDAQVDHVAGLLSLRDGAPIDLYATPAVFEQLTSAFPVLPVLQHYCGVHWRVVPVAGDRRASTFRVEHMPQLEFTAVAIGSPLPPHLAHDAQPRVGDSIALAVHDLATGQRAFFAPGLARFGGDALEWMREADCLLLDGMPAEPAGADAAGPVASAPPWLQQLLALPARHKVLLGEAPAGNLAPPLAEGIALAYDGMQIEL